MSKIYFIFHFTCSYCASKFCSNRSTNKKVSKKLHPVGLAVAFQRAFAVAEEKSSAERQFRMGLQVRERALGRRHERKPKFVMPCEGTGLGDVTRDVT